MTINESFRNYLTKYGVVERKDRRLVMITKHDDRETLGNPSATEDLCRNS